MAELDGLSRQIDRRAAQFAALDRVIGAGIIDTPMHKRETHGFLKTLHPIQRIGKVSEIVDAVLYLTDATFVTGEVLHVDGGAHAGKW